MLGLLSHGNAISVVGDNVSNFSTPGFKKQRAEFTSLVSDSYCQSPFLSAGDGSYVSRIRNIFSDGAIEGTQRELDFAIKGKGFFLITDGTKQFLTRAGNFSIDEEGFLVTTSGLRVLGFSGPNFDQLGPINLKTASMPPKAASSGNIVLNLDASKVASGPFVGPFTSFQSIASQSDFSASVSVVNSLGQSNQIFIYFKKTGVNTWEARAFVDGQQVGQTAGIPVQVGQAQLQFDGSGILIGTPQLNMAINWVGANPQNFSLSFSGSTQFAAISAVSSYISDGQELRGSPVEVFVEDKGLISVRFKNGSSQNIAFLAVGSPSSLDSLIRVSENMFEPINGFEILNPYLGTTTCEFENRSLERSNVDLAEEFVNLILFQKGFSANSKVMSTTSETIDTALNLKR